MRANLVTESLTQSHECECNIKMLQKMRDQESKTLESDESDSKQHETSINTASKVYEKLSLTTSYSEKSNENYSDFDLEPLYLNAFGIVLRLANSVARSVRGIRDVRLQTALQKIDISRQMLTNMMAIVANTISMSLSSVQVSQGIELLLKLVKIRKSCDGLESLPDTRASSPSTPTFSYSSPLLRELTTRAKATFEQPVPKCCSLNVLVEPTAGTPIRADIVFVHGLHGSQCNTWKQGVWRNERHPEEFQRPPKLPLRPPKRPRHTRTTSVRSPHKRKRARYSQSPMDHQLPSQSSCERDDGIFNDACCHNCTQHSETQRCDGLELWFSTYRLRMDDESRLLQTEFNLMLHRELLNPSATKVANDQSDHAENPVLSSSKYSHNNPNYSRCWPADWLPLDCPGVRILALNYTTDPYLWRPVWKKKEPRTNLAQRSREMTELLVQQRVGYGRPIIWVGHSKGGLYIKQILVDAWESGRPATMPLWRSARGVFFYSVPHRGSHLASIKAPLLIRSVELIDIEKNNRFLIDLHRRFVCLYQMGHLKVEVFSFVETALTLLSVLYLRIVGVDSADPGIGEVCGIHLDHREICKPRSRECILYKELVKMINRVCEV